MFLIPVKINIARGVRLPNLPARMYYRLWPRALIFTKSQKRRAWCSPMVQPSLAPALLKGYLVLSKHCPLALFSVVLALVLSGCQPEEKITHRVVDRVNDMKRLVAAI